MCSVISYASNEKGEKSEIDGQPVTILYSRLTAQPDEILITAGTMEQANATGKPIAQHWIAECFGKCGEVHFPYDRHDHADHLLRETFHNTDGTEVILANYQPTAEKPLISVRSPEKRAWMYDIGQYCVETEKIPDKNCNSCSKEMQTFDGLLWEINTDCGHGILTKGYYCEGCEALEVTEYFTRCGCSNVPQCKCKP